MSYHNGRNKTETEICVTSQPILPTAIYRHTDEDTEAYGPCKKYTAIECKFQHPNTVPLNSKPTLGYSLYDY